MNPPPNRNGRSEKDVISELLGTISASRLGLFHQCRLRFYFRYVLQIKKPKTPALHVGSAVHSVLKASNKARWMNQPLTLKTLHDEFSKAWADNSEGPVEWKPGEEEDEKKTGWRLCETYFRESNIPPNSKPDAVEVPVEADLKEHGLPKLVGILDIVEQKQIIDYKTTSSTPNPEKVAHTHEIQTSSYATLYRHGTGDKELGIQLHFLVKNKNPKLVITSLPSMNEGQQSRLFKQMESYLDGLDRRDFVPSPGIGCLSCDYYNECRRWK